MPIELICPGCQGRLRVPDTAAGQMAKCPQCSTTMVVPTPEAPPAPAPEPEGFPQINTNYGGGGGYRAPSPEGVNPYAAPSFQEPAPRYAGEPGSLQHTFVSFDDLVNTTWVIFKAQMSPMVILGAVLFGIAIAQQAVGFVIGFVGEASRDPMVKIGLSMGWNIVNLVIQVAITLGGLRYCLTLLRTGRTEFNEFMNIGPSFLSALLKDFLLGIAAVVLAMVCLGPGLLTIPLREEGLTMIVIIGGLAVFFVTFIYGMTGVYIAGPLIVDRNVASIESLKMSWEFTSGNRGTLFGALIVVGIAGVIFSCCTLYLGMIFFLPYMSLFCCVSYMLMTGQRDAIAPEVYGPTPMR